MERFTVRSSDGVAISVQKAGSGPPLLLVHGSMLNGAITWGAVTPALARHFAVYAMDRRGRAPSGDATAYSFSLEADDVFHAAQAVRVRESGPITLLGHSYGALLLIEAYERLRGGLREVERLILYEPPVMLETRPGEVIARMEKALEADSREEVIAIFLREQVRAPAERVARLKAAPFFPVLLEIAPTLPRESREVNTIRDWKQRLAGWTTPATMLLGTETTGHLRDSAVFVSHAIPGCEIVTLAGQGHGAMMDNPDLFVSKVLEVAGVAAQSR